MFASNLLRRREIRSWWSLGRKRTGQGEWKEEGGEEATVWAVVCVADGVGVCVVGGAWLVGVRGGVVVDRRNVLGTTVRRLPGRQGRRRRGRKKEGEGQEQREKEEEEEWDGIY